MFVAGQGRGGCAVVIGGVSSGRMVACVSTGRVVRWREGVVAARPVLGVAEAGAGLVAVVVSSCRGGG